MINEQSVQYLEYNKLITNIHCGFRSYRSTLDHLIRLCTQIKQAMGEGKQAVDIFCHISTTQKYDIVKGMHRLRLRGRLPICVHEYMRESLKQQLMAKRLKIRRQRAGVSQSVLSMTLFTIKIKSLAAIYRTIFYCHCLWMIFKQHIVTTASIILTTDCSNNKRKIQMDHNTGFSVSASKTVCMSFSRN